MYNFISESENQRRISDDQTDKHEQILIRNNIKLFGVPEKGRESYRECLDTVLQLFREAAPGIPWSEKDIAKVQRLGAPSRNVGWSRPRPLLVEITTFFDKLILLKYGRVILRNKGISIASELTTRQMKTLQDLRDEGHEAYFRNNKLWFRNRLPPRDATRQVDNRRKTTRHWKQDHPARVPPPTTRRHATPTHPTVPERRPGGGRQRPTYPQHHREEDYGVTGGTWAHPDQFTNGRARHRETTSGLNPMAPAWQRQDEAFEARERTRHLTSNETAPGKEVAHQRLQPPQVQRFRSQTWLELKQRHPPLESQQSCLENDATGSQLEDDLYETDTTEGSTQDGWQEIHVESTTALGTHTEDTKTRRAPDQDYPNNQETDNDEFASVENELEPTEAHDPIPTSRPKKQGTVLDWLTRGKQRESPQDAPTNEDPPSGRHHRDSDVEDESASAWSGRLRQRQTTTKEKTPNPQT